MTDYRINQISVSEAEYRSLWELIQEEGCRVIFGAPLSGKFIESCFTPHRESLFMAMPFANAHTISKSTMRFMRAAKDVLQYNVPGFKGLPPMAYFVAANSLMATADLPENDRKEAERLLLDYLALEKDAERKAVQAEAHYLLACSYVYAGESKKLILEHLKQAHHLFTEVGQNKRAKYVRWHIRKFEQAE
ncbi:MAG: hypothetical protein HY540_04465 [Deltaproteobacteria bacterium]|nr:hypothetical protein [Deltaproteobacteria bacterium]